MSKNEKELVKAIEQLLKLVNDLMPGVGYISLPDYALLNDAPRQAREAVRRIKGLYSHNTKDLCSPIGDGPKRLREQMSNAIRKKIS